MEVRDQGRARHSWNRDLPFFCATRVRVFYRARDECLCFSGPSSGGAIPYISPVELPVAGTRIPFFSMTESPPETMTSHDSPPLDPEKGPEVSEDPVSKDPKTNNDDDQMQYPEGRKVILVMIALYLAVFLIALVSASMLTTSASYIAVQP